MNMEIKPIYKMYKRSSDTSHIQNEFRSARKCFKIVMF